MTKTSEAAALFLASAGKKKAGEKIFKESFEMTKPAVMSGFRGMFGEIELSIAEENRLFNILASHSSEGKNKEETLAEDSKTLFEITKEIKAIHCQSILLHGERIQKAQTLLKGYQDGAFTAWLIAAYGNRQTPYSMLQYYELYRELAPPLQKRLESMPKKAAYTLAAREGAFEKKTDLLQRYHGQAQKETIVLIQKTFPLRISDKRKKSPSKYWLDELEKIVSFLESSDVCLDAKERLRLRNTLKKLSRWS